MHNIEVESNFCESKLRYLSFEILKLGSVVLFAGVSSLSLPIFIILSTKLDQESSLSDEKKILEPLLPYLVLLACRFWMIWNYMGHRMNGQVDAPLSIPQSHYTQAPLHVLVGYVANFASFTNAFLVGYAIKYVTSETGKWGSAVLLGCLNYFVDIYIQVLPAFRKHAEYQQKYGHYIVPFLQQDCNFLLEKYALYLSALIRELLPIIRGIIWTKPVISLFKVYISPSLNEIANGLFETILSLMIYSGAAYSSRFEIVQLRDNLLIAGKHFDLESLLLQFNSTPLSIIAKAMHGQLLIDVLKKIKMSTRGAVNFQMMMMVIAFTALQLEVFHNYLSSSDDSKDQGMILKYIFGEADVIECAPKLETVYLSVALLISIVSTYAKSSILQKYAHEREMQVILPIDDITEVEVFSSNGP